jgi:hypothetical protein
MAAMKIAPDRIECFARADGPMKSNCRLGLFRLGLLVMRAKPKTAGMMTRTMKSRRDLHSDLGH